VSAGNLLSLARRTRQSLTLAIFDVDFFKKVNDTHGHIAGRMRERIAEFPPHVESERIAVTVSGGLGAFPEDDESWDQIFAAADRRLYRSKSDGRNRVTITG